MRIDNFLDTSIFIHQLEGIDEDKATTAEHLIVQGIVNRSACTSFQVIQECLNTSLCKAQTPLNVNEMRTYMRTVFTPLYRVQPSVQLYQTAMEIHISYDIDFYDSLIIAAALEAGCKRIYSETLKHGQRIRDLIVENPFKN